MPTTEIGYTNGLGVISNVQEDCKSRTAYEVRDLRENVSLLHFVGRCFVLKYVLQDY